MIIVKNLSDEIICIMPAPTYIISKVADPIFAVFIGLSAAATRINREEKEKGKTTSDTLQAARRYVTIEYSKYMILLLGLIGRGV